MENLQRTPYGELQSSNGSNNNLIPMLTADTQSDEHKHENAGISSDSEKPDIREPKHAQGGAREEPCGSGETPVVRNQTAPGEEAHNVDDEEDWSQEEVWRLIATVEKFVGDPNEKASLEDDEAWNRIAEIYNDRRW